MTDLIDAPARSEVDALRDAEAAAAAPTLDTELATFEFQPAPTPRPKPETTRLGSSPLVIAGALGAAVVHFAVAGSHARASVLEGRLLVAAAWLLVGVALAVAWRPSKAVYGVAIAVASGILAAWTVSVTAGLPFGPNEGSSASIETVDVAALAFGLAVIGGSIWALIGKGLGVLRDTGLVAGGLALALTTAVLLTPAARDHAAWSHGERPADAAATGLTDAANMHATLGPTAADKGLSWLSNGHQHGAGIEELDAATQASSTSNSRTRS